MAMVELYQDTPVSVPATKILSLGLDYMHLFHLYKFFDFITITQYVLHDSYIENFAFSTKYYSYQITI